MSDVKLHLGDCLDVMATMDADSVDSIVTDPPYGLEFMGKQWDKLTRNLMRAESNADQERVANYNGNYAGRRSRLPDIGAATRYANEMQDWHYQWAVAALRVAKPGAHLLAFGADRTHHRLMCAIEDAGWEIRTCIAWVFGSGFPKSHNLKNEWQGWGTALKPSWEIIVVARKPLIGTVAANVLKYGTGALNIDGCRVGTEDVLVNTCQDRDYQWGIGTAGNGAPYKGTTHTGRWPANVCHDGSDEVTALFGDAQRFFYCAKASKRDRDEGLDGMPLQRRETRTETGAGAWEQKGPQPSRNPHPTVKPTALMRYLVRLVTPPGGVVLDPFMGSGSTGKAAALEGFDFVGIEIDAEYLEIARLRTAIAQPTMELFG